MPQHKAAKIPRVNEIIIYQPERKELKRKGTPLGEK
jgi:hypothetical protein